MLACITQYSEIVNMVNTPPQHQPVSDMMSLVLKLLKLEKKILIV